MPTAQKTKDEKAATAEPTPEEAEAAAKSGDDSSPDPEVRPEELSAGIGQPVGGSVWPQEIVDELRAPLDPNRVRTRKGRGAGKFEYLAGHDVKRRANEIFGFGNWGHHVKEIVEIGAVEVTSSSGSDGWHVGYRSHVSIWVRHAGGVFSTDGIGYGDGVEYTAAARVTASELAMKESETDALKRAFTDLGDQFGLILYAKDDEKKKIERDSSAASSRPAVRVDHQSNVPKTWPEAMQRFDALLETDDEAQAWLEELAEKRYGVPSLRDLTPEKRTEALIGFASTTLLLEDEHGDLALAKSQRTVIQDAFAKKFEGIALDGPPWRYNGDPDDVPVKGQHVPAEEDAS